MLSEVYRDIHTLGDEIGRLQAFQDALSRLRDALNAYAVDHALHLSPIQKLPFKLLADIFILC